MRAQAGGGQGAQREARPPSARLRPGARRRLPAASPRPPRQVLLALLAAPEGTTASAAGTAIGKSSVAYEYLTALRDQGIAELTGCGPSSRYRLAARPAHEPRQEPEQAGTSPGYLTIQALAEAVHAGLADADEATREVLEKVWEIEHRPPGRTSQSCRRCPGTTGEGDAAVTSRSFAGIVRTFVRKSFGSLASKPRRTFPKRGRAPVPSRSSTP